VFLGLFMNQDCPVRPRAQHKFLLKFEVSIANC